MIKLMTILALMATIGLTGCAKETITPSENTSTSGDVTIQNPEKVEEVKVTSLKNDFELLKLMPKDVNYMVSPLSLKMAMMLAANGAEGKTKEEILQVFRIENIEDYNESVRKIIEKYNDNEHLTLNIANSIWLNRSIAGEDVRFAQAYQNIIKEYYEGTSNVEDDTTIAPKANQWIAEHTNGKIQNMLEENQKADFLALLINTLYFKGAWSNAFEEFATQRDIFTDRNAHTSEVEFMHQTHRFQYYEDENMKLVRIPYFGYEAAMYVVLPENEEKMDIPNALENLSSYKVKLSLPKFKTEYQTSFKNILQHLGIKDAFDAETASFKNVMLEGISSEKNVYVSDVLQKTFIEVDEKGTEAAAATTVIMNLTSAMPMEEEIKEFNANRPFIYFILDESTQEILFMGEYAFHD